MHLDVTERRLTLCGELDVAGAPALTDASALLVTCDPGDSTLEVSGLSFVDAAGLGRIVVLANALASRGAKFAVLGAIPQVRRVFDITMFDWLLEAP